MVLYLASVGYHELYVNGKKVGEEVLAPCVTDYTTRARYIAYDIAELIQPGENTIGICLRTSWSIFEPYITADKPRSHLVIAQK
ncbi:MAG: alpha-L-rhamnosidase N-terminal domain-containing protein, partial [Bacteroidaceae bacterium]